MSNTQTIRLDWSVDNFCIDCGRHLFPASRGKGKPEGSVIHASSGYCHKCYSRVRRDTYSNPYFVDWSNRVCCLGCGRELRKNTHKKPAGDVRVVHYGRGMCKRCFLVCSGDPSKLPQQEPNTICPQCFEPLQGTFRKKFCTTSCQNRFYRLSNPHVVAGSKAKRRGLIQSSIYKVTNKDLDFLLRSRRHSCSYCKRKFSGHIKVTWDNIIPITRGGTHSVGNLTPACIDCNRSKHTKTIMEWKKYGKNPFVN
jgi:5-methylcytosine-specific restriction endonuclease McrA